MTANVKCIGLPFNKGDFYENHVAGPHPPDIFRGEMVVIVVVPNNYTCFWNFRAAKLLSFPLVAGLPRCLPSGTDSFYLQFQLTIWALYYPRKHINCTISLQERHLPTPLRHTEKHRFYWNGATLPLQSSSLHSPNFNVDKPTEWLSCSLWHLLKIFRWTLTLAWDVPRNVYRQCLWQCFPTFLGLRNPTQGKYNLRYPMESP